VGEFVERGRDTQLGQGLDAEFVVAAANVLHTDNGAVFTASPRRNDHGAIEPELLSLGIRAKHSRPYHPQTCGKIERFHQTLKRHLAKQPTPATKKQLQAQLDQFAAYYNQRRPHREIGRPPLAAFTAPNPPTLPDRSSTAPATASATTASVPTAPSPSATKAASTTSPSGRPTASGG